MEKENLCVDHYCTGGRWDEQRQCEHYVKNKRNSYVCWYGGPLDACMSGMANGNYFAVNKSYWSENRKKVNDG